MVTSLGVRWCCCLLWVTCLATGCQATPSAVNLPTSGPHVSPGGQRVHPAQPEVLQAPAAEPRIPFARLDLTDEQKRQIEAIPGWKQPDRSSEYQRVLLAPQVDVEALKALLTPSVTEISTSVEGMVALRDLLTPRQRQLLVEAMKQDPPTREHTLGQSRIPDALTQRLGLSPAQQRALSAMNAAFEDYHRSTQAQMLSATESFMATGDASALRLASLAHARSMPIAAMVAYYSGLNQAQRRLLFGQQEASCLTAQAWG